MDVHVDQVFLLRESRDTTPVCVSQSPSIARAAISYVTIVILECVVCRRFTAVLSESVAAWAFRESVHMAHRSYNGCDKIPNGTYGMFRISLMPVL